MGKTKTWLEFADDIVFNCFTKEELINTINYVE